MIANKKMMILLNSVDSMSKNKKLCITSYNLKKIINPKFVKVHDCIIISEKQSKELEKYYNQAMSMYDDEVGYEASNTETRINDYFEKEITVVEALNIGIDICETWKKYLKMIEPQSQFCMVITCDGEYVTLRFHKIRSNTENWLCNDLERYEEPVAYEVY
jgi:hypothetical protein